VLEAGLKQWVVVEADQWIAIRNRLCAMEKEGRLFENCNADLLKLLVSISSRTTRTSARDEVRSASFRAASELTHAQLCQQYEFEETAMELSFLWRGYVPEAWYLEIVEVNCYGTCFFHL
jgi:hypothetical protein